MRKPVTNKTQILRRTRFRKHNPEAPPEDNYREAKWHSDDINIIRQDNLYTLAWEEGLGGQLFDLPNIYTDPNASDFDESETQGPDTFIVPSSYFHDPSDAQNWEDCPASHPSAVHLSNHTSHDNSQDLEITTDLRNIDSSKQKYVSNTDIETTYEPMQHPTSRQNDPPSTIEVNDATSKETLQDERSKSRGSKYNLRHNPTPTYSKIYR